MRAPPPHRRRRARALLRRPAFAVVAALVWLLGVELGPGLHIARHGELGHHHHGASEALACASEGHAGAGAHAHLGEPADHEDDPHHPALAHAHEHRGANDHAAGEHHHAVADAHEHHAARGHHEEHEHHAAQGHHGEHAHHDDHPHDQSDEHHAAAVGGHDHATAPRDHATDHEDVDLAAHGAVPHGAGSLAHRDLVPLTPPLALPPILSAPWQPVVVAQVLRITPRDRTPSVLRARGPPRGRSTPGPRSHV